MAWSTVSSQTQSCRSRAWLGMSSIVAQVARRQHDPGQPRRRGGDDLFLDAADRQDEAAREISSVIALSLLNLRSVSSDKSAITSRRRRSDRPWESRRRESGCGCRSSGRAPDRCRARRHGSSPGSARPGHRAALLPCSPIGKAKAVDCSSSVTCSSRYLPGSREHGIRRSGCTAPSGCLSSSRWRSRHSPSRMERSSAIAGRPASLGMVHSIDQTGVGGAGRVRRLARVSSVPTISAYAAGPRPSAGCDPVRRIVRRDRN